MKIIPKKAERPTLYHLFVAWVLLFVLVTIVTGALTFSGVNRIQHHLQAGEETMNLTPESFSRSAVNRSDVAVSLERIKSQVAVSFVLILVVAGFVFYAMNKRIVNPLHKIISGLSTIQKGNLNVTMNNGGSREIEQIESLINDISSNFQEILLLVWTHSDKSSASCHRLTESIRQLPDMDLEMLTEIASIHQRFREMRSLVSEFEFYDVTLNEDKVLAG